MTPADQLPLSVVPTAENKPTGGKGKKRQAIDWEKAERLYRAGRLSLREMAHDLGCGHGAIVAKAKKHGWSRDTTARANTIARAKLLTTPLADGQNGTALVTTNTTTDSEHSPTDVAQVEAQSEAIVEVSRRHIAGILRARSIVARLFDQLDLSSEHRDALEDMATEIAKEGGALGMNERRRAMVAAVSLASHAATSDKLINQLKTLINLERQAYGMGEKEDSPDSLEAFLSRLADRRRAGRTIDITP